MFLRVTDSMYGNTFSANLQIFYPSSNALPIFKHPVYLQMPYTFSCALPLFQLLAHLQTPYPSSNALPTQKCPQYFRRKYCKWTILILFLSFLSGWQSLEWELVWQELSTWLFPTKSGRRRIEKDATNCLNQLKIYGNEKALCDWSTEWLTDLFN